jgi:hypothetical protein
VEKVDEPVDQLHIIIIYAEIKHPIIWASPRCRSSACVACTRNSPQIRLRSPKEVRCRGSLHSRPLCIPSLRPCRCFWEGVCRRGLAEWFQIYDIALLNCFLFLFGDDHGGLFLLDRAELCLVGVFDVEDGFLHA